MINKCCKKCDNKGEPGYISCQDCSCHKPKTENKVEIEEILKKDGEIIGVKVNGIKVYDTENGKPKTENWEEKLEKFYFTEYRDVDQFVSELKDFIRQEKELSQQEAEKEVRSHYYERAYQQGFEEGCNNGKEVYKKASKLSFDDGYQQGVKEEREKVLEVIENIKKRFRCAACDGAKCSHTLGCQALQDIKNKINDH